MKLLYLMGAGRSGTTILSLLLSNLSEVRALGELHQLPEHAAGHKLCNCGETIENCHEWQWLSSGLMKRFSSKEYRREARELESHRYVFRYFFRPDRALNFSTYRNANEALLNRCKQNKWRVDSAKYVGRGLALSSILRNRIKFVYLIRDPRGVVNSFGKSVQTPRGWLSAVFYYGAVNATAWFVSKTLLRGKVITIRYEDLLQNPCDTLSCIAVFLGIGHDGIDHMLSKPLSTGHVIGGNRLVKRSQVRFNADDSWRQKLSIWKRWGIWILLLPWCLLNGYKP